MRIGKIAVAVFLLVWPSVVNAGTDGLEELFKFVNPPKPIGMSPPGRPKTKMVVQKEWKESEKAKIIIKLKEVQKRAPGLIERATVFGKVKLYRSTYGFGENTLATAESDSNVITLMDLFFSVGAPTSTISHELTHLADPALVNELSDEWQRLVGPRCEKIRQKLATQGIKLNYKTYTGRLEKEFGDYARRQGMPSVYACVNWAETLAEQVENMLLSFRPPEEIRSFISRHYFTFPYKPTPALMAYHKAKSLFLSGSTDQAIKEFTDLLSTNPEMKSIYLLRGRAWLRKKNFDKAQRDLNRAADIYSRAKRYRLAAYIHFARADVFEKMWDYKSALRAYDKSLEFNPGWVLYHYDRGKLLLENLKEPDRAIADFNEILRLRPDSTPIYLLRAQAWEQKKDYRNMETDFAKAIELNPEYPDSYMQRAYARKERKMYKEAIDDYTKVIELVGTGKYSSWKKQNPYFSRAKCKEAIKNFRGAIEDYTKLIQISKRINPFPYPQFHEARGIAFIKAGELDKAIEDLRIVLRLFPARYTISAFGTMIKLKPEDPRGYFWRGKAYLKGKKKKTNIDHAIADLTKAIELSPLDSNAYLERGGAYALKKDYTNAIADLTKVIELKPRDSNAYLERGRTHALKKDYTRAIVDLDEAIKLNQKFWFSYYLRSVVKEKMGQIDAAIKDCKKAQQLNSRNKSIAKRLKALTRKSKKQK